MQWITSHELEDADFEVRSDREGDAFHFCYVAWRWKAITRYDLRVDRHARIRVVGQVPLMSIGNRLQGQEVIGPGYKPKPEQLLLERFTEGERAIFLKR